MNIKNEKSKIISSLLWSFLQNGGTQVIQFILQIVLARLLAPSDYGNIALVSIFILLANVFVQSGFNTALIQKKEADNTDFSSVFCLSLFVSVILYIMLFFIAPVVSAFYKQPILTNVLRLLSITLFFGAFNSIQNAYVARNMMFKKLFYSSLGAMLFSGIIGIIMAYLGFGVWALVLQQITNQALITLIMWFTVKWRPKLLFSLERVKQLFSYGWKLLLSNLIDTLYMNIRGLIIGRIYSSAMLGYFNRGNQFPALIINNINGSIQSVMLPALSSQQDNRIRVKNMVRRAIVTSSYVIFPMMVGLAATAEPIVKILLTDKWLPCVPFIQIFCATYALWPIHTANLQAINAIGRSDIFLKLEIVKKIIGIIILIISLRYGVYALAWGSVISGIISSFINAYPNTKLLDYSYKEQIQDIIPSLLISLFVGLIVYSIKFSNLKIWLALIIQILMFIIVYLLLSYLLKLNVFFYLLNIIREIKFNKMDKKQFFLNKSIK